MLYKHSCYIEVVSEDLDSLTSLSLYTEIAEAMSSIRHSIESIEGLPDERRENLENILRRLAAKAENRSFDSVALKQNDSILDGVIQNIRTALSSPLAAFAAFGPKREEPPKITYSRRNSGTCERIMKGASDGRGKRDSSCPSPICRPSPIRAVPAQTLHVSLQLPVQDTGTCPVECDGI